MEPMTETGKTLRALRQAAGFSLRSLANTLCISPTFLSDIETGRRRLPLSRFDRLPKEMQVSILDALRVDILAEASAKLEKIGTPKSRLLL